MTCGGACGPKPEKSTMVELSVVRRVIHGACPVRQHAVRFSCVVADQAAHDPFAGLRLEVERGDYPKIAAAATNGPEQIGIFSALTRRTRPSAVTSSAARRLSMVRPCVRTIHPMPPPRVKPPTPT